MSNKGVKLMVELGWMLIKYVTVPLLIIAIAIVLVGSIVDRR